MDYGTVLEYHRPSNLPLASEVMEEALVRKWVMFFGDGQYVYGRNWATLVRLLQVELVRRAQLIGFDEWILPRYIPRRAFDSFKLTQFAPDLLLSAGPNACLDPVQCISFYEHLRGTVLTSKELPIRVVEVMGGWTWRNETLEALDGPFRAKEFLRVEHVFCGTPEQVKQSRRDTRKSITGLLTELGLGWQIVVGKGCMDLPSLTQRRLGALVADDIPVQDIEIPIRRALHKLPDLPTPGTTTHGILEGNRIVETASDADYWDHDEICGCSVEGDHLTTDFGILDESGQPLWSGCCGIGLNRLVLGLLYQHGFEAAERVVRDAISKL